MKLINAAAFDILLLCLTLTIIILYAIKRL